MVISTLYSLISLRSQTQGRMVSIWRRTDPMSNAYPVSLVHFEEGSNQPVPQMAKPPNQRNRLQQFITYEP